MVRFTKHAETRLEERDITKALVLSTLEKPDIVLPSKANRNIAIRKYNNRYLKVVYVKEGDIIVLTTHWISPRRLKV